MHIDATEYYKLTTLLRNADIPYQTVLHTYAMGNDYQICIPSVSFWQQRKGINIAINALTYGHEKGLLELWDGKGNPNGYLTAEEAFEKIKEMGW